MRDRRGRMEAACKERADFNLFSGAKGSLTQRITIKGPCFQQKCNYITELCIMYFRFSCACCNSRFLD